MTDLERVLKILERNGMWELADSVRAHEKEDAEREADRDHATEKWTKWWQRAKEAEAELATLQEAVREHLERWECGGRLRQLVEENP